MDLSKLKYEIERLGIKEYVVTDSGVDILQDFQLPPNIQIEKLPFKVDVCYGDFNVGRNQLKTLENFPNRVMGEFHIGWNKITSLEGSPSYVHGDYYCYDNPIKTNYCDTEIGGGFHTTLKEDGLVFINESFVTKNYNEWRKWVKRKKIINQIVK